MFMETLANELGVDLKDEERNRQGDKFKTAVKNTIRVNYGKPLPDHVLELTLGIVGSVACVDTITPTSFGVLMSTMVADALDGERFDKLEFMRLIPIAFDAVKTVSGIED